MALTSKSALISLAVAGTLALSACGSTSTPSFNASSQATASSSTSTSASASASASAKASASASASRSASASASSSASASASASVKASASASAAAASVPVPAEIQTFADSFVKAYTSNVDGANTFTQLGTSGDPTVRTAAKAVLAGAQNLKGSPLQGMADAAEALPQDQKDALLQYVSTIDPLHPITDLSNLSPAQQIALGLDNFTFTMVVSKDATNGLGDNTIDASQLKVNGNTAKVPMKAIQALGSSDRDRQLFADIPAVNVDGTWKIDGKAYFDKFVNTYTN